MKKGYKSKPFESSKSKDSFATLYSSMLLDSLAWKELTYRQRNLYVYMKLQYYSSNKPSKEHEEYFYFNKGLYLSNKRYALYTNEKEFRKDRDILIEKGFIKCISDGSNQRVKSVYSYSDNWSKYGSPGFSIPNEDKTLSLHRKEKFIRMVKEGYSVNDICDKFNLNEEAFNKRITEYEKEIKQ